MDSSSTNQRYHRPDDIFTSTADAYVAHRPPHPPTLLDYLSSRMPQGDAPVLDLGCGPGVVAIGLARRGITPILAVDPSPEMLTAGQRRADAHNIAGITWQHGDSTSLHDLPTVRAVTIADAFHYMDRLQTLRDLDGKVEAGGFVAIIVSRASGARKPWWEARLDEIRDRHLGAHRAAGPHELYHYQHTDHEAVLRYSPFNRVTVLRTDAVLDLSLDDLVGIQWTYAFSSHAVLGERRQAFEDDVRATLTAANLDPSGRFTAVQQTQVIIGERP